MYCPHCGFKQICGCSSCLRRYPQRETQRTYVHLGLDIVACGNCGLSAHVDWWENLDLEMHMGHMKFATDEQILAAKLAEKEGALPLERPHHIPKTSVVRFWVRRQYWRLVSRLEP